MSEFLITHLDTINENKLDHIVIYQKCIKFFYKIKDNFRIKIERCLGSKPLTRPTSAPLSPLVDPLSL